MTDTHTTPLEALHILKDCVHVGNRDVANKYVDIIRTALTKQLEQDIAVFNMQKETKNLAAMLRQCDQKLGSVIKERDAYCDEVTKLTFAKPSDLLKTQTESEMLEYMQRVVKLLERIDSNIAGIETNTDRIRI